MLRFLKALFGRTASAERQPASAHVPLADLEQWLEQARAPRQAKLTEQLAAAQSRISELAAATREKVQALQSAQLMNPDIPERAKDTMQGNREEYCKRVLQYLDTLALPQGTAGLPGFFSRHAEEAQAFTHGILKPFQVLQEFFAHESKEITALLANIEQEILTVQTAHDQAKLGAYDAVHREIASLTARLNQRRGLEQECADLERQHRDAEQNIRTLDAEEERLLKDPVRHNALQKIAEAERRVKAHEQKAKDLFTNFQPALRRFHRMATRHVKLVEHYLRDPVGTLVEDLHLDLLEVIADIKRLLAFDRLPLGDKREQVLDALALLTKDWLGTWLREYGKLTKAVKDAQQAVDECEASKALTRVQRLRDETRRTKQLTEQRLAQVQKDLNRINLDELRAALETRLKDLTGTTVTITF